MQSTRKTSGDQMTAEQLREQVKAYWEKQNESKQGLEREATRAVNELLRPYR